MDVRQAVIDSSNLDDPSVWAPLVDLCPDILLVFANRQLLQEAAFIAALSRFPANTIRFGASSVGEITPTGCSEQQGILTALKFDHTVLQCHALAIKESDSLAAGRSLGAQFAEFAPDHLFVLAPDQVTNGEALVAGIQAQLPETQIMGGLAGDVVAPRTGVTLLGDSLSATQVVAVGFKGKLQVQYGAAGGWCRFGPARKVTNADERRLYTLNGEGALSLYKRYLGNYAAELPYSGLFFPLSLLNEQHQEVGIIRSVSDIDEAQDALVMAGTVAGYDYVQMMCASTDALVSAVESSCRQMVTTLPADLPTGLGIMISCIGRKIVMGGRTEEEVDAMTHVLGSQHAYCGMHAFGEISPMNLTGTPAKQGLFYNQTASIAFLYE